MKFYPLSACFAGILAIVTSHNSIAGGEEYDECVDFGIKWCSEHYSPADVGYSICILQQIASCDKTHGGGGGGVGPVANNFTAEQKDTFDTLLRDLKALRLEKIRAMDELTKFFIELREDAYRQNSADACRHNTQMDEPAK